VAPGTPAIALDPDAIFLLFLPPILFAAAYATSWRDLRANLRPIGLLAVGCVFFTTVAVAVVAHTVIAGFSWPVAFVLGAIVAPPDVVAATAIFQRLGVPLRLVTILEGESLVNDASALVADRFAVAAVVTGTFAAVPVPRQPSPAAFRIACYPASGIGSSRNSVTIGTSQSARFMTPTWVVLGRMARRAVGSPVKSPGTPPPSSRNSSTMCSGRITSASP